MKVSVKDGKLNEKSGSKIYLIKVNELCKCSTVRSKQKVALVGLDHYLESKNTLSSNEIIMHEKTKAKYSINKISPNIVKEMTDLNVAPDPNKRTAENAKIFKQEIKKEILKQKKIRWCGKILNGNSLLGTKGSKGSKGSKYP